MSLAEPAYRSDGRPRFEPFRLQPPAVIGFGCEKRIETTAAILNTEPGE